VADFGSWVLKLGKQQADALKIEYLGSNPIEEALVRQWIEYSVCAANYSDSPVAAQHIFKVCLLHLQKYLPLETRWQPNILFLKSQGNINLIKVNNEQINQHFVFFQGVEWSSLQPNIHDRQ